MRFIKKYYILFIKNRSRIFKKTQREAIFKCIYGNLFLIKYQLFENEWEVLSQDPYYEPTTEEELEDSGTNVASLGNNIARKYMDQVRRRKVQTLHTAYVQTHPRQNCALWCRL